MIIKEIWQEQYIGSPSKHTKRLYSKYRYNGYIYKVSMIYDTSNGSSTSHGMGSSSVYGIDQLDKLSGKCDISLGCQKHKMTRFW